MWAHGTKGRDTGSKIRRPGAPNTACYSPPPMVPSPEHAATPRSAPFDFRGLVQSHKVIVCVGSGGVGKTTTSAALAMSAAMDGKRVLCLTIDPAKRLANSLGLGTMTMEEREVPRALFEAQGLPCRGSLFAMMLDTKRTFDGLVEKYASSKEVRDRIFANEIYQYVSTSLAGTREYMAMEKLHSVRAEGKWDLIVLDTPPTSNALDFLEAPERLAGVIDSPALRWLVRALSGTSRFSIDLLNRGATLVLKALAKFTGASFLEQVATFVTDVNELFGGFRERAERVAKDLRGPDVAFVVVTSPSPFALAEAQYFVGRLNTSGLTAKVFVVNGVHPSLADVPGEGGAPAHDAVAAALGVPVSPEFAAHLDQAYAEERIRADSDRAAVDAFEAALKDAVPRVEVPAFDQDVHDLAALHRVAQYLGTSPIPLA